MDSSCESEELRVREILQHVDMENPLFVVEQRVEVVDEVVIPLFGFFHCLYQVVSVLNTVLILLLLKFAHLGSVASGVHSYLILVDNQCVQYFDFRFHLRQCIASSVELFLPLQKHCLDSVSIEYDLLSSNDDVVIDFRISFAWLNLPGGGIRVCSDKL